MFATPVGSSLLLAELHLGECLVDDVVVEAQPAPAGLAGVDGADLSRNRQSTPPQRSLVDNSDTRKRAAVGVDLGDERPVVASVAIAADVDDVAVSHAHHQAEADTPFGVLLDERQLAVERLQQRLVCPAVPDDRTVGLDRGRTANGELRHEHVERGVRDVGDLGSVVTCGGSVEHLVQGRTPAVDDQPGAGVGEVLRAVRDVHSIPFEEVWSC